jgi:hypothetical protein
MKSRHAAALALVVMLSSCGYVQTGPTAQSVKWSEIQYKDCMRTTDYPSECAYEKQVRDFVWDEFHMEVAFQSYTLPFTGKL